MGTEKRDFDKEAVSWDEKAGRVKMANDIAEAISEQILLTSDMDVLDFGCGTGLLTLRLQPLVRSVTGADSSQGMLEVLQVKVGRATPSQESGSLLLGNAQSISFTGRSS